MNPALIRKSDSELGKIGETYTHAVLKEHFGDETIRRTRAMFDIFDFVSEDRSKIFEVKTRRCAHDRYSHTIVGNNKIEWAQKLYNRVKVYFVFNFVDNVSIIEYDPVKFADYKVNLNGRVDRGRAEIKPYIHIPYQDLTIIRVK